MDIKPEWLAAMAELYRRVDHGLAALALACHGCGNCCHFESAEHILYASDLERLYLAATAPPIAALPEQSQQPELMALINKGLRCPYQMGERCLARQGRVLGCRLHFCQAGEDVEIFAESMHQELKRLHDRLGIEWRYAPLLPVEKE
ncbi:MAG: hypothetical protein LIP23_09680 [Planctomycetes bacterium]|nr:hypothetical protein [Planctomycetota bacterium]